MNPGIFQFQIKSEINLTEYGILFLLNASPAHS